jgi:hypothetical protein
MVQHLPDSFRLAPEPQAIAARLVLSCDDLAHLQGVSLAVLFSERELHLHGGVKAAIIALPTVQGPLRHLFSFLVAGLCADLHDWHDPDYLVLVDRALWSTLDPERRERLVYHELCHVQMREDEYGVPKLDAEGKPFLKLVPHDCEVFDRELERYGPVVVGIEATCDAIVRGAKAATERASRPDAA